MGWTVEIGRKFSKDSTLILMSPEGRGKEAAIESDAWVQLGCYLDILEEKVDIDSRLAELIWEEANFGDSE